MGFDAVGSVAGEVQDVGRTLSVGVVIASFGESFVYSLPIVAGMCVLPQLADWKAGSFVTIGESVLPWMGVVIAATAMLSSVGIFEATLATTSRQLWAMAGGCPEQIPVAIVPRVFAISRRVGECSVPYVAVLFEAACTCVLVNLPFDQLVVYVVFFTSAVLAFEYAAFVYLRFSQPDAHRGFRVPGGKLGMWLCVLPQAAFATMSVISAGWFVIVVGLGFQVLILACFYIRRAWRARLQQGKPAATEDGDIRTNLLSNAL